MSFNQLRLATTELASADAQLERIGKALAGRLTYLMEPICPIEIDARRLARCNSAAIRRSATTMAAAITS